MTEEIMEVDELKRIWQSLETQLQRQNALQFENLRLRGIARVRARLRPLALWQLVVLAFGIALVSLGVTTWRIEAAPWHLVAAGVSLHVLGVGTCIAAIAVMAAIRRIDDSMPVLEVQRRLSELRYVYVLGGALVGLPWWLLWVPCFMALAALLGIDVYAIAYRAQGPFNWISLSLLFSALGLGAALAFMIWVRRARDNAFARRVLESEAGKSLTRAQAELDAIAKFATE